MGTQATFLSMTDTDFTLVLRNSTQLTRDETRSAVRILRTGASARQLNGLVADFHDAAKHFAESSSSTEFKQLVVHYRGFIEFVVLMEVTTGKPLLFANTVQTKIKMPGCRLVTREPSLPRAMGPDATGLLGHARVRRR